jgi:hypothetical protein
MNSGLAIHQVPAIGRNLLADADHLHYIEAAVTHHLPAPLQRSVLS